MMKVKTQSPPSAEAIARAREIIKQGFALAEGMPRRGAATVLAEFEEVRDRLRGELADLPPSNNVNTNISI